MCGIFAYTGTRLIGQNIVLSGLKNLEYRGYDSWGIAVKKADKSWWLKKQVGKITGVKPDQLPSSNFALGHTRWATHGGVTVKNAHPHAGCDGRHMIVHNGIIENYRLLKSDLVAKGHRFTSETDSEVIAHLFEEYIKSLPKDQAALEVFRHLAGQSAVIIADRLNRCFIAFKQGSPLVIGYGTGENYLASDPSALVPHTKRVYFMRDGEMAVINHKKVTITNISTGRVKPVKPAKLDLTLKLSKKGKHRHYMIKEIEEQSQIIGRIAANHRQANLLASDIKSFEATTFTGCGSAYFAGLLGSRFIADIAGRQTQALVASEAAGWLALATKSHLLVALSQSGETMDLLEAVKSVKSQGKQVDALVNVVGSSLYRTAKHSLPLNCGQERAVGSTKAFMAKLAYLLLTAYKLANREKAGLAKLKAIRLALDRQFSVPLNRSYKSLLQYLKKKEHLFVVGRGTGYLAGREIALKLKEIAYLHAECYLGSEIKHGPIALITPGSACLVVMANDTHLADNLSTASELKARGGYIIGLSPHSYPEFDVHLPVDDLDYETVFGQIMAGQLLSYHLAVAKHLNPDMPRNLAKSVTVK